MDFIDIKDIDKRICNLKLIGSGTTARCYKLNDGSVLKLFKKNYSANLLLTKEIFNDDLSRFKTITNDTFIGPNTCVICNNKIIGYIYPYVEGCTLKQIDNKTKLKDIFKNYKQVLIDTKDISNKNFRLFDIHDGNIIYSNGFLKIIDLDKGCFYDDGDSNLGYISNSREIFDNVFGHIYNKKTYEIINFKKSNLQKQFSKLDCGSIDSINKFIDYIAFYCHNSDPTVFDVKRNIKVKKNINDYL